MIHFESAEDRRISPVRAGVPVKVEIEDPLEDAHAPSTKKQKQAPDQVTLSLSLLVISL